MIKHYIMSEINLSSEILNEIKFISNKTIVIKDSYFNININRNSIDVYIFDKYRFPVINQNVIPFDDLFKYELSENMETFKKRTLVVLYYMINIVANDVLEWIENALKKTAPILLDKYRNKEKITHTGLINSRCIIKNTECGMSLLLTDYNFVFQTCTCDNDDSEYNPDECKKKLHYILNEFEIELEKLNK